MLDVVAQVPLTILIFFFFLLFSLGDLEYPVLQFTDLVYHLICYLFSLVCFSFLLMFSSSLIATFFYFLFWNSHCVHPFFPWVQSAFLCLLCCTLYQVDCYLHFLQFFFWSFVLYFCWDIFLHLLFGLTLVSVSMYYMVLVHFLIWRKALCRRCPV